MLGLLNDQILGAVNISKQVTKLTINAFQVSFN